MDFLADAARIALSYALDLVFPPRDAEKIVRESREGAVFALIKPETARGALETRAIARFRTPLMRSLVHEAKYRGNGKAQALLGAMLARYLEAWMADERALTNERIVLVPIPLSGTRFRERGFNQCEAIARAALGRLKAEVPNTLPRIELAPQLLTRVRDTEHQTALTKAGRQANVAGAFAVPAEIQPLDANVLYIVFDDVLTTGATLGEAVAALRAAGAVRLFPLTLSN